MFMNCPSCGWPISLTHQWETHGFACAIWRCSDCDLDMTAKTPVHKFRNGKWITPQNQDSELKAIVETIESIVKDARPSNLKSQIEDVINDA